MKQIQSWSYLAPDANEYEKAKQIDAAFAALNKSQTALDKVIKKVREKQSN